MCHPVCRGGVGLQYRPRVMCCPVCMQGGYNRTAHNTVCVANPPPTDRTAHNMVYLWGGGFATQTVLCAVLSVGCYNTDCVLRAILSVRVGLQHRPRVTCCPVCMQGGYNRTAHNTVYLWGGGGFATQTACYVPSCLSGLVRVGGYNTDRMLSDVLSVGVG